MSEYKRLTNEELEDYISRVLVQLEPTLSQQTVSVIQELLEYRTKIENGTLIECNPKLIGESVIGIHHFTNGTYELDLDENIVIGFGTDGIVTWNSDHAYNDYFNHGLYFIDNEEGRAEAKAEARLKELRNEKD